MQIVEINILVRNYIESKNIHAYFKDGDMYSRNSYFNQNNSPNKYF